MVVRRLYVLLLQWVLSGVEGTLRPCIEHRPVHLTITTPPVNPRKTNEIWDPWGLQRRSVIRSD